MKQDILINRFISSAMDKIYTVMKGYLRYVFKLAANSFALLPFVMGLSGVTFGAGAFFSLMRSMKISILGESGLDNISLLSVTFLNFHWNQTRSGICWTSAAV